MCHSTTEVAIAGIYKSKAYQGLKHPFGVNIGPVESTSASQALGDPRWFAAMQEEFQALEANKTLSLVPSFPGYNVVGNKFVFKLKYHPDDTVYRYKAQLVAEGFHHNPSVDFSETCPVVKPITIRVMLSLVVRNSWDIQQLDVNNAFLNGVLHETVYMSQLEGFTDPLRPSHVCKLHKALYNLKQAPRAWFEQLQGALLHWDFDNSKADSSFFINQQGATFLYVLVYVDDILVIGSCPSLVA